MLVILRASCARHDLQDLPVLDLESGQGACDRTEAHMALVAFECDYGLHLPRPALQGTRKLHCREGYGISKKKVGGLRRPSFSRLRACTSSR